MKSIDFSTGVREYAINGDENNTVKVMISDLNILDRISGMESRLSELSEKFRDMTAGQVREMDMEVRDIINTAFGSDVCTAAFGHVNSCSPLDGGKLLFEGFVESLAAMVRSEIESMDLERSPRPEVERYLK